MANPHGGYLTENLGYTWADGDIYRIDQADAAEAFAAHASFGGLGVENEPHQILLNKIKLARLAQIADEANIAVLQARNTWVNFAVFNNSGSLIMPKTFFRVIVVGGGGGGCGSLYVQGKNFVSGAGGGAGARIEGIFSVIPGFTLTITIGPGGVGGSAGGFGGAGGLSNIAYASTIFASAPGGSGGLWGNSGGDSPGGLGGQAILAPGVLVTNGGNGSDGQGSSPGAVFFFAGNGAPGPWGGGGRASMTANLSLQNGAAPGAGGGGSYGGSNPGGSGAPGVVVVNW